MNYRTLGRTQLRVSELGFGALEIGRDWPPWRRLQPDYSRPSEVEALRILHRAVDEGVNFFDTAPAYMASEEILGKAFKAKRDRVVLATKCGEWFDGSGSEYNYSAAETLKFIENSLRRLQTDFIDLLQIHSASAEVVRSGETLTAMKKAQEQGKVRFIGLSTDDETAARLAVDSGEYDSIQVTYNVVQQEFSREVFPSAASASVGVIVKGGMGAGQLTARYRDIADDARKATVEAVSRFAEGHGMPLQELALRFVFSSPAVSTVIIGTKNASHLKSNIESLSRGNLDPDVVAELSHLLSAA